MPIRRTALNAFRRSESGSAAVEMALVLPVLSLMLFATITFGTTLYNYNVLVGSVAAGARQFAVSRGNTTPVTSTKSFMTGSAPNFDATKYTLTFAVSGTACATGAAGTIGGDKACADVLQNGLPATVTASYPCNLVIMGVDFAPGCQMSATTTMRVE